MLLLVGIFISLVYSATALNTSTLNKVFICLFIYLFIYLFIQLNELLRFGGIQCKFTTDFDTPTGALTRCFWKRCIAIQSRSGPQKFCRRKILILIRPHDMHLSFLHLIFCSISSKISVRLLNFLFWKK